ncbi:putative phage tail assembly chaperone [Endozoicomonas sp. SCSIO W0465]|uniref:putative phage tail assembly chaperone n=1 Tax=Endozoicomonas sp. SCSIO W0465 TaxID=2918516 RepID=UPI002074F4DF|nr:putative phage tail assembly chaperone [Endozoicomonas sp. SCSIO W0465]USE39127.1 putative phage tail assembly chaperone [Endozoicomonas sp. SCSIO W0465]
MHNFLINVSANDETKELVKQAYDDALTTDLFGVVSNEFKPNVEITVKKYKGGPMKLTKTG